MFKRKKINLEKALKAIYYYQNIPIKFVDVDIVRSIELYHNLNIYAYDAYFLECAINLNIPLNSLDSSLLEIAKKLNITTIEV
jgi:predicted nucleic acid-binding protein